jgi:hypothetical protein
VAYIDYRVVVAIDGLVSRGETHHRSSLILTEPKLRAVSFGRRNSIRNVQISLPDKSIDDRMVIEGQLKAMQP